LVKDDRPAWNDEFHRIRKNPSDLFKLRSSGFNEIKEIPLTELLHRFSKKTVAENQMHPFCTERQQLDMDERSGVPTKVPKSKPVKGQPLYYDPWDAHVKLVNDEFRQRETARLKELEHIDAKRMMYKVPDVKYFPTTRLKELRSVSSSSSLQKGMDTEDMSEADFGSDGFDEHSTSTMSRIQEEYPFWEDVESEWKKSFEAAKEGDLQALYDYSVGRNTADRAVKTPGTAISYASETELNADERLCSEFSDGLFGHQSNVDPDLHNFHRQDLHTDSAQSNRADRLMMMAHSGVTEDDE
jgi:hypothetical protein